jgi:hypothetical protein
MWKIVFLAPLALVVAWILYVCSPFAGKKRIKGAPPQWTITEREKELAERDRKLYRGWFFLSVIPAAVISAGLVWVIGEQQRLDTAYAAVIFAVLLVASVSLIGIVRRQRHFRRCSTCGKSWALKRTGGGEVHQVVSNRSYRNYYHADRVHQALEQRPPRGRDVEPVERGRVVSLPRVGGRHHRYTRAT